MGTIKFYQGDESRVVKEDERDFNDSIFSNQYTRAFSIINRLQTGGNDDEDTSAPQIVAFCGDRGEGKTSCMLSVKEALKDRCLVLNTIDPSFFDEKHNILELVLGQLYSIFLNRKCYYENKEELLDAFNEVRSCVSKLMAKSDNVYDAIDELDELGNGMNLRRKMAILFQHFLDFVGMETLVIVIDDMDYNWKGAYEMTQMISKYLCHDNCILLISVSINQMVEVIQTSLQNQLKAGNSDVSYEVAYKYVEKLIPLQNRVDMPHVYDICNYKLEIFNNHNEKKHVIDDGGTIKDIVVQLIFRKTRYLFYNYRDGVSLIVPQNLRMLRQLLGILVSMEDYDKESDDPVVLNRNKENKSLFQSYFFVNWAQQLNPQNRSFVKVLKANQDLSQVNKLVVMFLMDKLPKSANNSLTTIVKPENYSYNISVGDVFSVIDFIERNPLDDNDRLMVFFLKSYYSMTLYHNYDDITMDVKSLHPDADDKTNIFRMDSWFKGTNKLQRLVNGAYFQYVPGELLRAYLNTLGNDGKVVKDILVNCDTICLKMDNLKPLLDEVKNAISDSPNNISEKLKAKVIMAEIIVMLTSWGSPTEIARDLGKRRNLPSPFHLNKINEQTRFVVIDILAPFSNTINLKFAYERYEDLVGSLYNYASQNEWTLLGQMKKAVSKENDAPDKKEHYLASDAVIRNAEVLTSMHEKIHSRSMIGDNIDRANELIADYYNGITDSEMATYPINKQDNRYYISFKFLKVISENLRAVDPILFKDIVLSYQKERSQSEGIQLGN